MKTFCIIVMTLSVAANVFLFIFLRRLADKYFEVLEEAKRRQELLVQACSAIQFYNKNIAKGTAELPKLDPFHTRYK